MMNNEALNKLFAMLPDSKRKQELVEKYNQLQTKSEKRGGEGLQDSFEFKPVGHIKIEAINDQGEVVGTLADQPNLVVDGAEEILLRSFSGDPSRVLYKNRIPKSDVTNKILIDNDLLLNNPIIENDQLIHDPNIIWSAVNDEDFEISYGYYPITVYIKEDVAAEFNKKAFVISKTPQTGFVPMNAEIYSTYSNMFIGLGDGLNYKMNLEDERLVYSEGLEPVEGKITTTTEGDEISFTEKISNFAIEFEASNTGAQIDVFVNGVLKETIESLESELLDPEVRRFEYDGLSTEEPTTIKLVHSGSDSGVENPVMAITGLYIDALEKGMNSLVKEFQNFVLNFDTPTVFNTTSMAPYTVQLPHFPVEENSVVVRYNDSKMTQVETEEELVAGTFMVDHLHGLLRFNSALTGLMVTYSVTGEIYDVELANGEKMTAGKVVETKRETLSVADEMPAELVNGSNKLFKTRSKDLVDGTLVVKVDGTPLLAQEIQTIDLATGSVLLVNAPTTGSVITFDYQYVKTTVINKDSLDYKTDFVVNEDSIRIIDQDGNELVKAADNNEFGNGKFLLDELDNKLIHVSAYQEDGSVIERVEVIFTSSERPGVPTNYSRALIEKPKSVNEYPWFELDNGSVKFVAEFDEINPNYNVTIREMGLFDGPRVDDKVAGFRNYPVKAFSLVRIGDTRKDVNTGIRITWTITLVNNEGIPFQGGNN